MTPKYKNRIADELLRRKLFGKGAVLIEGPKWCGKTTTAKQQAKSVLDLGDTDILSRSKQLITMSSKLLLQGDTPRLIDEWQTLPSLWDTVRTEVDKRNEFGQFILTGSSVPPDLKSLVHSGTGRFGRLKMRPMSLFESGESNGTVSLQSLFNQEPFEAQQTDVDLEQIAYLICRGGWPQATLLQGDDALEQAFDYYNAVSEIDIQRVDGTRRNAQRTRLLMRSYARNTAQQVPFKTMRSDMLSNDNQTLNEDTIIDYVEALRKLFVIEDLPAWSPNLRSKSAIRTTDTRHFVDPSIATAALGIGPKDLIADLNTFGLIFETMAVRDLRVYGEVLNGTLYHYRDSSGKECDAVLHLRNGMFALIEIKLGGLNKIEEGAHNLKALANVLDTTRMQSPSFLMVLTAVGPYAYQREDGIFVIPISCLRP